MAKAKKSSMRVTKIEMEAPKKNNPSAGLKSILQSCHRYSLVAKFDQLAECQGIIYFFGQKDFKNKKKNIEAIVSTHALNFQKEELLNSDKKSLHFMGQSGPVWMIFESESTALDHAGLLNESSYTFARENLGQVVAQIKNLKLKSVALYFQSATNEAQSGAIIGLELAGYNFLSTLKKNGDKNTEINIQSNIKPDVFADALQKVVAIQMARHLVNLPPNLVHPASVEEIVLDIPFSKNTKISVWNEKKCEAENMNLLLATGAGSPSAPRMIHFRYRPSAAAKTKKNKKPIAFVGKGVTFDTGGLDIKPSAAMRLMKKDMGGAASVVALAYWADATKYDRPLDFYLALAENSVDGFSMRPSDVYQSRAGYLVEIDNTDAEGRLVLADVMDVAVKQTGDDHPEILVDIATLTGAIKVALGADVAGLFTNDDKLATQIMQAGQEVGEPNWRMPLIQKYFSGMSSQFADFKNSADGFGGAITAALFLQKFAGAVKWVHLDVYAWNDKPTGCLAAGAASGQPVQSMIKWLESQA